MIEIVDIITIVITFFLTIKACKYIRYSAVTIVYLTFIVLYAFPLLLDYTIGFNTYETGRLWGFIVSREDFLTSLLYDFFLIYNQIVLLFYKKAKYKHNINYENSLKNGLNIFQSRIMLFLWIGAFAAPIWMAYNAASELMFMFLWRETRLIDLPYGYTLAESLTFIGISSSIILFFNNVSSNILINWANKLLSLSLLYVNICIQGKRVSLFFALVNIASFFLFYIAFRKNQGNTTSSFLKYAGVISSVLMVVYMVDFSLTVYDDRGGNVENITHVRIDFLRDDRVRMAIFSEIHPEQMTITDKPLQTVVDDILTIFPLNFLQSKIDRTQVWYQTRFTCALSNVNVSRITDYEKQHYSFMTTTVLAEFISNMGVYLGLLLIPFLLLWFVDLINRLDAPFNMLLFNSFFLLNLFDFSYVSLYLECIVIWILYRRKV